MAPTVIVQEGLIPPPVDVLQPDKSHWLASLRVTIERGLFDQLNIADFLDCSEEPNSDGRYKGKRTAPLLVRGGLTLLSCQHYLTHLQNQIPKTSIGMNVKKLYSKPFALVLAGLLVSAGLCGCQTQMGGQTLPSATYLLDDVQYFPAGPEVRLPNTRQALEEYRATGEVLDGDIVP